jgi:hypothetical protein
MKKFNGFNQKLEDKMSTQERMNDSRTFRITAIAVAAAAVLVIAAYLFGTNLRADTQASVAPSPLGSSLTVVRAAPVVAPSAFGASSLDARGARTTLSAARAAALAELAKSRSDFYADQNNSAAAARSASLIALAKSRSDFYADQSNSARAVVAPAAVPAVSIRASHYARLGNLTAAEAAGLGNIAPGEATLAASYYARLGSLTAAEAASLGNIAPAADPYQDEWMGFTAPESVGAKSSVTPDSAADQSPWIKPEGILPAEAGDSATGQRPWIKPEGIEASGAK